MIASLCLQWVFHGLHLEPVINKQYINNFIGRLVLFIVTELLSMFKGIGFSIECWI